MVPIRTKNKQKELLNAFRSQMSREKKIKVFKVFTSKNIDDIIEAQPQTIEELAKIKGFPLDGMRINGYGEAIINIIKNTDSVKEISINTGANGEIAVQTSLEQLSIF